MYLWSFNRKSIYFFFSLFIIVFMSLLYFFLYLKLSSLSKIEIINQSLFNIINTINLFSYTITPTIIVVFFLLTGKLVINIFSENCTLKELFIVISFSLIPILIYIWFYTICLYVYIDNSLINSISDLSNLKFIFGIKFSIFSSINSLLWAVTYATMTILYFFKLKISLICSLVSVFVPTSLVYLAKNIL